MNNPDVGGMPNKFGGSWYTDSDLYDQTTKEAKAASSTTSVDTQGISQTQSAQGSNQTVKTNIPQAANLPKLPQPTSEGQATLEGKLPTFEEFKQMMGTGKTTTGFADQVENLLSQVAQQKNFSNDQLNELRYTFYHPDSTQDPETKAELKNILSQAGEEKFSDGKQLFDESVSSTYESSFKAQLSTYAKANNLSESDVNQLKFAFNNPDTPNTLSPTLKNALSQMMSTAAQQTQTLSGASSDVKPTPSSQFNNSMLAAYDAAFNKALDTYTPPLTDTQRGMLLAMHYFPDANIAGSDKLNDLLKTLQENAAKSIAGQYGLPAGFIPKAASQTMTLILAGAYQDELSKELKAFLQSPEGQLLSDSDKQLLEQALANPDDPTIPPHIKEIVSKLVGNSISAVRGSYNLPEGVGTPEDLSLTPVPSGAGAKVIQSSMEYLNDVVSNVKLIKNYLNEGPEKSILKDFLKAISDAISALKSYLYVIVQKNAELSTKISNARMEMQLEQLKEQQKQIQANIDAQNASGGKGGGAQKIISIVLRVVSPIVMVIAVVIAVALAAETGGQSMWLAVAIIMAMTAVMVVNEATNNLVFNKLFEGIDALVGAMMPGFIPDELSSIFKIVVKSALILAVIAVTCVNPLALLTVGLSFGMSAIESSGVVQEGIAVCGGDQKAQMIASMVVGMVLAVATMVLSIAMMFKLPGLATQTAGKIANAVIKSSQESAEVSAKVAQTGAQAAIRVEKTAALAGQEGAKIAEQVSYNTTNTAATVAKVAEESATSVTGKIATDFEKFTRRLRDATTKIEKAEELAVDASTMDKIKSAADNIGDTLNAAIQKLVKTEALGMLQTGLQASTEGLQMGSAIIDMKKNLALAALALLQGQLQAAIEEIQAMIKVLTKILNQILDGVTGTVEWIKGLTDMQVQSWQKRDEEMTKLTNAVKSKQAA